ncbi:MAG: T9SS type A sorting domain-containing protein, partial [Fimbriimonadaceae bacterium]|nr:T9SS type A sorting domain-containing protein [Chitinophagales bacterium]
DDNCNSEIDEGFNKEWHADIDHDEYGNFAITAISCSYPDPAIFIYDSWVHNNNDCHDENALSHPGALEYCDGEDNNCNSLVDETESTFILYADLDYDLYIDYNNTWTDCFNLPALGNYITEEMSNGSDCNDSDPEIPMYFIPAEVCNGIDDDCDGAVDEDLIDATIYSAGSTTICQGSTAFLYCTIFSPAYQWYKNDIAIPGTNQSFLIITEPGNYALHITQTTTDGSCTSISNTITIDVLPLPLAKAKIQGSNNLCGRHHVKLKTLVCTGCSYQWYKNGTIITGAINTNYNTTVTGNFQVSVTGANGCSAFSNTVTVIKTCREDAMEHFTEETILNVYPNPASEKIIVEMELDNPDVTSAQIIIYTMLGQKLMDEEVEILAGTLTHAISFDEKFTAGMYILKVVINDAEYIRQFVVNR